MVCDKWEETGLLFSSGELSSADMNTYAEHLKVCEECAGEYAMYTSMKSRFFSPGLVGAKPSEACDAKILRACSEIRKPVTAITSLSLFTKRAVLSLSLFVIGFISVSYISIRMNGGSIEQQTAQVDLSGQSIINDSNSLAVADSSYDSLLDNGVNYAKTRGNLGLKGVVPVELQNK